MMSDDVGHVIRVERERRGWSQEFLAAKVGATQSTIDRIESGLTRRSRVLPEIALILELDLPGQEKRASYVAPVGSFVRVSYVLPKDLIERVDKYKSAIGASSDDEVVRKIIDDFLKKRDTFKEVIDRILEKFRTLKSMREAAGTLLGNHPLVTSMAFNNHDGVEFVFKDAWHGILSIQLESWGHVMVEKEDGSTFKFYTQTAPSWASKRSLTDDIDEADDVAF